MALEDAQRSAEPPKILPLLVGFVRDVGMRHPRMDEFWEPNSRSPVKSFVTDPTLGF